MNVFSRAALGQRLSRTEFIRIQNARLDAEIGRFARPGDSYALVDFPNHANIGDSAIWLGATRLLRRLTGRDPLFVSAHGIGSLAGLERRLGTGTIYINGGGNFGDLWPGNQPFRDALLDRFPENRIVQLPQSIHFRSDEAATRCAAAISRHGDFHLIARDEASLGFAVAAFDCPVTLAPDCAFALGPLRTSGPARHDLYCLLRDDRERLRADRHALAAFGGHIEDWVEEAGLAQRRLTLKVWADMARARDLAGSPARPQAFEQAAGARLARGIDLLSSGRQVVTDRLHGHLLCLLLGVPHVALDNVYGKIGAYFRTWTHEVEGGLFAPDNDGAVAALSRLWKRP